MKGTVLKLRRRLAQAIRATRDFASGTKKRIVNPASAERAEGQKYPARITVEQPILPTESVAAKIHNIELARRHIENLPIPPGGVFSVWRLVGRATSAAGFQSGRSLLGGELRADFGGGLCQLSGIIYHASLLAGLHILERHPHSRDIYDDDDARYTPLGADATVAYGFKDLRVTNSQRVPICFRFALTPDRLTCWICSSQPIQPCRVEFAIGHRERGISLVETRRQRPGESKVEILAVSSYRKLGQS